MRIQGLAAAVRELQDHRAVVDALYRFTAGQDHQDESLFYSAFTADAVLDFTQPASGFGSVFGERGRRPAYRRWVGLLLPWVLVTASAARHALDP